MTSCAQLLLVRYFFLHHITQRHGHRRPTADSQHLDLTHDKVRRDLAPLASQQVAHPPALARRSAERTSTLCKKPTSPGPSLTCLCVRVLSFLLSTRADLRAAGRPLLAAHGASSVRSSALLPPSLTRALAFSLPRRHATGPSTWCTSSSGATAASTQKLNTPSSCARCARSPPPASARAARPDSANISLGRSAASSRKTSSRGWSPTRQRTPSRPTSTSPRPTPTCAR